MIEDVYVLVHFAETVDFLDRLEILNKRMIKEIRKFENRLVIMLGLRFSYILEKYAREKMVRILLN